MASQIKSLLIALLLICITTAEVTRDRSLETRERFCGLTYEQKTVAVHCIVNGFPPMIRDWFIECSRDETGNEALGVLAETVSDRCSDAPQPDSSRVREYRECVSRKEEENPDFHEQIREQGHDYVQNMMSNCVNQAATGTV